MAQRLTAVLVVLGLTAAWPASAADRPLKQTFVFDSLANGTFLDKPPAGPSPGDTESSTGTLRDVAGHVIGSARDTCVFTKNTATDVLERCSGTAKTREGTVTVAGVGRLRSMNPPWRVTGRSGAYKGVHGKIVYATDIPLDPNVPLAAGRMFSVSVIVATVARPLKLGVVPRPAANAPFIRRANAACNAIEHKAERMPGFPFADFDPFRPDAQELPQVGQFFNAPARRRLGPDLLSALGRLGRPPASRAMWQKLLAARRTLIANERRQASAALAGQATTFVQTVYQQSRDYNVLVLRSAAFGVQSCTFG